MNYTIAKNNQFNSIEINFSGKPCEAIRSALKNIGFRWHSVRRICTATKNVKSNNS